MSRMSPVSRRSRMDSPRVVRVAVAWTGRLRGRWS